MMRSFYIFTCMLLSHFSYSQLYCLHLMNHEKALEWRMVEDDKVYYAFKHDTTKIYRSRITFIEKNYFLTRKHKVYPDSLHYIGSYRRPKAAFIDGLWIGFHLVAIPISLMPDPPLLLFTPVFIEALITKRYLNFTNRYGYLNRHSELKIISR